MDQSFLFFEVATRVEVYSGNEVKHLVHLASIMQANPALYVSPSNVQEAPHDAAWVVMA